MTRVRPCPAPEIFLTALKLLRSAVGADAASTLSASSTLVFEDAPSGVEAGIAAGMQVGAGAVSA